MPVNKPKKKVRNIIKASVILTISFIGFLIIKIVFASDEKFIYYPEFGIEMPQHFSVHGIDVSHYQQKINWKSVKEMSIKTICMQFAFIKVTEGITLKDKNFSYNWRKAKEHKITRGAYHFFNPAKSGKEQAAMFIKTVTLSSGDLPPVLDIETIKHTTAQLLKKEVQSWLTLVEKYYGVTPIIYTNVDFYNNYFSSSFDKYPLWVAHYYQKEKPSVQRDWAFWQHHDKGHINGIATTVDCNVFNGDSTQLKKLLLP